MKVLQLSKYYPPIFGGIELVAEMFSKANYENHVETDVWAFTKEHAKHLTQYEGLHKEKVTLIYEDAFFISTPISFNIISKFKQMILASRPNVILVHVPNPMMHFIVHLYGNFLKKLQIEIIAIYHSDLVNQKNLMGIYNSYFKLTSSVYNKIVVSSDNLWQSSTLLNSLDSSKKRVIPFCIKESGRRSIRQGFHGRLLAIGRLVPYKGFEFLIKAISKTDYYLNIIGTGPLYNHLKKFETERIKILGKVSEEMKLKLIDNSDLLIMSSINRAEAYGMIIVEAYENGLPVICADIKSGVTYLVDGKIRGLLFAPQNEQMLLECLEKVEHNPELINLWSNEVSKFYDQNLSFKSFATNVSKLLFEE